MRAAALIVSSIMLATAAQALETTAGSRDISTNNAGLEAKLEAVQSIFQTVINEMLTCAKSGKVYADPTVAGRDANGCVAAGPWIYGSNNSISYSAGNVGIKTTTPSQALDVNGIVRAASGIQFGDGTKQTTAAMSLGSTLTPRNGPANYAQWSGPYNVTCPANKVMVGIQVQTAGTCHKQCDPDGPIIQNIQVICR